MRGLILAFAGGLALAGSAQAAPLGPTSIRAANVVTVQLPRFWPPALLAGRAVDIALVLSALICPFSQFHTPAISRGLPGRLHLRRDQAGRGAVGMDYEAGDRVSAILAFYRFR